MPRFLIALHLCWKHVRCTHKQIPRDSSLRKCTCGSMDNIHTIRYFVILRCGNHSTSQRKEEGSNPLARAPKDLRRRL
eukprot:6486138-Amphidinium_carterae.3